MELKAELNKPYTEKERLDFIIINNHGQSFEIRETEDSLQAWGYTQEEFEQQKEEQIKRLTMSKRVFAIGLQELGISYGQLKEIISTNEQAQLEWDLCIELQRSNPLLESMASILEITPKQLDILFLRANGKDTEINTLKRNEE